MKKTKRKNFEKWKPLTKEQEKKIVRDWVNGRVRNVIMREHDIPEGQFYHIAKIQGCKL